MKLNRAGLNQTEKPCKVFVTCLLRRHDAFGVVREATAQVPTEFAQWGMEFWYDGQRWLVVKRVKNLLAETEA